jgi:hypothetical protein
MAGARKSGGAAGVFSWRMASRRAARISEHRTEGLAKKAMERLAKASAKEDGAEGLSWENWA